MSENYALDLLKKCLNDELRNLHICIQMTQGKGFFVDGQTIQAFMEMQRLAMQRIPQLNEAIALIENSNKSI